MSTIGKLRRIALNQQGLLKTDKFGRGKQATLRAIEHIGYVQIDTISVVERAHHHVLWSRVSNYQPKFLDQLVKERKLFEYWFHAASWLPMRDFRFALPRMAKMNGERDWFKNRDSKLNRPILARVREEGPLRARDFEDTRKGKKQWWDWKPAKQALEQLFMQGELMVRGREGFQKVYDLPERVLPDWVDTREPGMDEYAGHLVDTTLRAHGFATLKSISYLRKGRLLRDAIREQLQVRIDAGSITTVPLKNNSLGYVVAELFESRAPRSSAIVRILSPFDNAVIQRERGRDIFDFDYQIECYVPEAKRQFGYFCLPILYRDRFVGRIDCKAHRSEKRLDIKSVVIEHQVDDEFADALCHSIQSFALFNGCGEISDLDVTAKILQREK
ncbi:MAG: winged helix DNA-binding domain-containing protein [Gammaproteobacteria bacterium]|nr:winged helix DNA-binding domain-containing protein [Gammaproteobacteria bacterium]